MVEVGKELSSHFSVLFWNEFGKNSAGMPFKLDWGLEFQYLFLTP